MLHVKLPSANSRRHWLLHQSYPKPEGQFILDTDASDHAVGAVLSQEQDMAERLLGYFSKALTKTEQVYCVTRKELVAVVMALKYFHPYLYGREIILRTNNAAVSWMRNLRTPTGQTARWLELIYPVTFRSNIRQEEATTMLTHCPGSHVHPAQDKKPLNSSTIMSDPFLWRTQSTAKQVISHNPVKAHCWWQKRQRRQGLMRQWGQTRSLMTMQ